MQQQYRFPAQLYPKGLDKVPSDDLDLIFLENTDHHLLHEALIINGEEYDLYSLNIAQISAYRSMTRFVKMSSLLRTRNVVQFQKNFTPELDTIFRGMRTLLDKTGLSDPDLRAYPDLLEKLKEPRVKIKVTESNFPHASEIHETITRLFGGASYKTIEFRKSENPLEEAKVRVMKQSEKKHEELTADEIDARANAELKEQDHKFMEYFGPSFHYFDITFSEESKDQYKQRIRNVFHVLQEKTRHQARSILCLQEINPLFSFLEVLDEFPEWRAILPRALFQYRQKLKHNPKLQQKPDASTKNYMTKSCSFLLVKGISPTNIRIESPDEITSYFQQGTTKNPNQNQKYVFTIGVIQLVLYNIHAAFRRDKAVLSGFQKIILPQIMADPRKVIIAGDFNFQLNQQFAHRLKILCGMHPNLLAQFTQTPEIMYPESVKDMTSYDGIILKTDHREIKILI